MHPQRLHALDNLRAVMMWLGIVLHVAVNHMAGEMLLPWRDRETSQVADMMVVFIHTFRMPVFFILAGFFVAMLVARRGNGGMLKHRLRRLALPFVVFWPPIFFASGVLAMMYVHLMTKGSIGIDPGIMPQDPERPLINTMHMWFIYYLIWFCALAALLGRFSGHVPAGFREGVAKLWVTLATRWWGFIVLAVPLALVGLAYKGGIVKPNGSFIPQWSELVHNGLFFVVGFYAYRSQDAVLSFYARYRWRYVAGGLVFFLLAGAFATEFQKTGMDTFATRSMVAFTYNCATWLWSFALIGLFVRYLPQQNSFLRYVSESSYWVYLVHMLGTIGFGVLLYDVPVGALAKIGINIAATTLACIATYQLLVRYTPIGTLLNGRRLRMGGEKPEGEAITAMPRS